MSIVSQRAQSLGTENAFIVLAEVNKLLREGRDIVSFCIGQPDFHTPVNVQDAAVKAIREGRHGYTPSAGIAELRQAAGHGGEDAQHWPSGRLEPMRVVPGQPGRAGAQRLSGPARSGSARRGRIIAPPR